uniref:Uncharacterized protein n=1 Tax=Peronospora matthiolae TaxID=2874970 RepID=A0AAV1T7X5_9STRA
MKADLELTCSIRSARRVLYRCYFLQYSKIEEMIELNAAIKAA